MATGLEMEVATRARLKASVELHALSGGRYDWGLRPTAALPAITLTRIPGPTAVHFKGDQGLQETRVQVDVWAPDYATAKRLAQMVKEALEPPAQVAAIAPHMAAPVRFERSFADQPDMGTEQGAAGIVHRARFDIGLWWALVP